MSTPAKTVRLFIAISSDWYKRSTHYLFTALFELHKEDEDARRKERILTITLFGIIAVTTIFEISIIIEDILLGNLYHGISLNIFTFIFLMFIGLFVLTRKGYVQTASYIFVILYFLGTAYGSFMWGASMPIGLLSYALVIIIATITISINFGVIITILSFCSIVLSGALEVYHNTIPAWKKAPIEIHNVIEYGVMICLATVLSWLSNRELQKSLLRARTSEHALKIERDNLEEVVSQRTKALLQTEQERIAELSHFAEFGKISAGLFHDLLNPLTAVSLSVSSLQNKPDSTSLEQTKHSIEIAIHATQKMESYMKTIRRNIKPSELKTYFSVNEEIESALEIAKLQVKQHGITCKITIQGEIVLYGNPISFNQILSNLIVNALDAYKNFVTNKARRVISVAITNTSELLTVSVTDFGKGIPNELQKSIFKSFFTTKETGIGLGLARTKDIIEKDFNGTITCTSKYGKGTTFTVCIPHTQKNKHDQTATNQCPRNNNEKPAISC